MKSYLEYIKESQEIGEHIYLILSDDKEWIYRGIWGDTYYDIERGSRYFERIEDIKIKTLSKGLASNETKGNWVFDSLLKAQEELSIIKDMKLFKKEKLGRIQSDINPIIVKYFFGAFPSENLNI